MRIFFFSNCFWRFFEFIFVLIRIKFVEEEKHDNHSIFDKDFINAYFAYGEVLAIDVEKGRKNNFEAFKIWGEEFEKSVDESKLV